MLHYTNEQLASVVALPIVTILLVWTTAIFQRNRKSWGSYDIPVVSILILSIIRNLTILAYTLFVTLNQNTINLDYCSVVIWIFNSIHTFQASSLTTLAIIGLFSVKLHRKHQHLRQFLTATHVIYHLFCLTTLCACVGVAAILAQKDRSGNLKNITIFDTNPCKFMPFDLDIKFNVFIIVLNVFLACISIISFGATCFNHFKTKKNGFDYLKKSNSDLSDLSLGLANEQKNYCDTYIIHRGQNHMDHHFYEGQNNNIVWNSDVSNISTTVSSTNSRRPCIPPQQTSKNEEENSTGLETILPVLIVCYLFYHLPLIVLCVYPSLVAPWPIAGVALWLGLIQDILIPISLSIVDSRFCKWVSNVYKCSNRHADDKPPHVGLDGKFRTFSSPPQSLEVQANQHTRGLQAVEHRFPITNGSLYTSIDGRVPVIHNYRRHKDQRGLKQLTDQGAGLRRQEYYDPLSQPSDQPQHDCQREPYTCRSCEADLCPSHSNLHHLSPQYINKQLNLLEQRNNILLNKTPLLVKRTSLSQESLRFIPENRTVCQQEQINPVIKNSRNLVRLNRMRLSKSEDSLVDPHRELKDFRSNIELFQKQENRNEHQIVQALDYSSSDDDYLTDNINDRCANFDTLSSQSSFSITTEANGDFEFYQSEEPRSPAKYYESRPSVHNYRIQNSDGFEIRRSNSRKSLENFQTIIENIEIPRLQRSNSYMTLEDRKKNKSNKKLLRSNSKLSDCTHNFRQKVKSVEYLPNSNASTVFIEDVFYFNYPSDRKCGEMRNYVGSVPDLKKVFISEYI